MTDDLLKNKCWKDIHTQWLATAGSNPRSKKQLRFLWKNLKAKAKKELAADKRGKKKTGDGPEERNISELSNKIICLLPQEMHGLQNAYDDDQVSIYCYSTQQ